MPWTPIFFGNPKPQGQVFTPETPPYKGGAANSAAITQQPRHDASPTSPIQQSSMKTKDIDNSEEPLKVSGKVEPNVLFQAMSDLYKIGTPQRSDNKIVEYRSATFDTSNSPSNIDRSPKQFSRQELDKFRAELLEESKIQMEIDRKNMEKQIQNHYLS